MRPFAWRPSLGCTNNCIKRPTSSVSMSEDTSKPFARTSAPASRNARLSVEAQPGIVISADRAISCALIVNELVSNAAKHAYQGHGAGRVWVKVATTGVDSFSIAVRDEGGGASGRFRIWQGKGPGGPHGPLARGTTERVVGDCRAPSRRRVHSHRAARPIEARRYFFASRPDDRAAARSRSGMGSAATAS